MTKIYIIGGKEVPLHDCPREDEWPKGWGIGLVIPYEPRAISGTFDSNYSIEMTANFCPICGGDLKKELGE